MWAIDLLIAAFVGFKHDVCILSFSIQIPGASSVLLQVMFI